MLRPSFVAVVIAVLMQMVPLTAAAQSVPQPPSRATAETCAMFRSALTSQIQAIYKRTSACMRKGPSWSTWLGSEVDRRPWCTPGPPERLRAETTAYPDCAGEQEALCDAYQALRQDVPACFGEVRASQSEQERRLASANDLMELNRRFKRAERIIWNPELFMREIVLPRLPAHVRAKLDMYEGTVGTDYLKIDGLRPLPVTLDATTFAVPRQLSKNGTSLMQDLYGFLFGNTAGSTSLRSGNPVIASIQGDAASKIKAIHSSTLGEMETIGNLMDTFISIAPQAGRATQGHSPARQPTSTPRTETVDSMLDCSLLDGPGRTELAVQQPDKFERLVEQCVGK